MNIAEDGISKQQQSQIQASVITYPEAEEIIAGELKQSAPSESLATIGTLKWMNLHELMAKLNIQGHLNVALNRDEFITELVISHEKVNLFLNELLAIRFWKEKVYPTLLESSLTPTNSMLLYMTLYHEATVINLLEIFMMDHSYFQSIDSVPLWHDLIDYCRDRFVYLQSFDNGTVYVGQDLEKEKMAAAAAAANDQVVEWSEMKIDLLDQLGQQKRDLEFGISISCLALFRYLTDKVDQLPSSVLNLVLNDHDFVLLLARLLQREPWKRRNPRNKTNFEIFEEGQWLPIRPEDAPKLWKIQAQVWLSLYNLLLDQTAQKKYQLDEHRKEVLLGLRPLLQDTMIDQLPNLEGLKRYLEQLQIYNVPETISNSGGFILREIPSEEDSILIRLQNQWSNPTVRDVITRSQSRIFQNYQMKDVQSVAQGLSKLYDLANLDPIITKSSNPRCENCFKDAVKRCSRCKLHWYCGRDCQVKHWPKHKQVCVEKKA